MIVPAIQQTFLRALSALLLGVACAASALWAQSSISRSNSNSAVSVPQAQLSNSGLGNGPIHAGDQVNVAAFDAPDMSVSTIVSQDGFIPLPVYGPFHIDGMTSTVAAETIRKLYLDKGLMSHPVIQVTVQQYGSGVTVMGEVTAPGYYTLAGHDRLADVLAQAGGLRQDAGQLIEITSKDPNVPVKGIRWDASLKDPKTVGYQINPGDLVMVSKCGVAYVHGNVNRPGGYPICDSGMVTLSQVLALAGGIRPSTNYNRSLLIRTENGQRTVREIRLNDIIHGRSADIPVEAEDIVYVEPSWQKFTVKTAVTNAIAFAETAWIYLR